MASSQTKKKLKQVTSDGYIMTRQSHKVKKAKSSLTRDEAKKAIRSHVRQVKKLAETAGLKVLCALGKSDDKTKKEPNEWATYIKWFRSSKHYKNPKDCQLSLMEQAKRGKDSTSWLDFISREQYDDKYDYDDPVLYGYDGYDDDDDDYDYDDDD